MKERLKNKKSLILKVLIVLLVITTIIAISLSISKFESKVKMVGSTTVALMASDVYATVGDEIRGYPGCEPFVYEIIMTNKENGKICEVSETYAFKIERENTANLPIEISLYADSDCTQELSPDGNGFYKSDDFKFLAGVEQSKKFYLKITWPETVNSELYAFEIDYFRIHVLVNQID